MDNRQLDCTSVMRQVQVFMYNHDDLLGPINASGVKAEFDALVAEIEACATTQGRNSHVMRGATKGLADAKRDLREFQMGAVIAMANTLAERISGLAPFKLPPARIEAETLAQAAVSLADAMNPYLDQLVQLGLGADCLDRLRASAEALTLANAYRGWTKAHRVGATVGVEDTIRRAKVRLKAISVLVRKRFHDHPELLAEWKNVRRLPAHGPRALTAGATRRLTAGQPARPPLAPVAAPKALMAGPSVAHEISDSDAEVLGEASGPTGFLAGIRRRLAGG